MKKTLFRLISVAMICAILMSSVFGVQAFAEQIEIKEKTPVLDENGNLTQSGYCFTPLYQYDRSAIKTSPLKTKEWDFYQISNDRYTVQVTIADISLGGAVTVGYFDRETGEANSTMVLNLLTLGKFKLGYGNGGLCEDDSQPHKYVRKGLNFDFECDVTATQRTLKFKGKAGLKDFTMDLVLEMLPVHESHYIAVPFNTNAGRRFYYNQKTNCMATTGTVTCGDTSFEFKGKEDNSYAVLDWGRGVWPFHQVWWWGNGSTTLDNGDVFGFEIGWGFGDTSCASESTAFLNGKAYKLGYLSLVDESGIVKPLDSNWADNGKEWKIVSDDGSFEMTMTPEYDNYTMLRFLFVGNLCHQVFGKWNGTVRLGDETIEIKDMTAFLERSDNMW